jgi:AraC-like DNA-binding protein
VDETAGRLSVWRCEEFPLLELHTGERVEQPHPRHWHDEVLVCAITGGAGWLETPGRSELTAAGSVFTVSAGQVHANHAAPGGCSFVSVYLSARGLEDALGSGWGSAAALDSVPTLVTESGAVRSALLGLHRVLGTPTTRLQREAALCSLLTTLHPGESTASPLAGCERRPVSTAEAYLRAHWDRSVSLAELSRASGLSPFHLHRSFSRSVGLPPHAFQLQLRVDRAKTLLARGVDIASVAQRTGFADQSHFTRVFRRSVGVTPGRFPRYPGTRAAQCPKDEVATSANRG